MDLSYLFKMPRCMSLICTRQCQSIRNKIVNEMVATRDSGCFSLRF